jgi:hypothetical protein
MAGYTGWNIMGKRQQEGNSIFSWQFSARTCLPQRSSPKSRSRDLWDKISYVTSRPVVGITSWDIQLALDNIQYLKQLTKVTFSRRITPVPSLRLFSAQNTVLSPSTGLEQKLPAVPSWKRVITGWGLLGWWAIIGGFNWKTSKMSAIIDFGATLN